MAYTCPDIQGIGVTNTRYYDISANKRYAKGATLPTIGDGDEIELQSNGDWNGVYIGYAKSGTTMFPAGWWLEGANNIVFQVPESINGKPFKILGDANAGGWELQYEEVDEEDVPWNVITSFPYRIPSSITYMRGLFKNQSQLTGLIKVDANPVYYANWLQGTTQPIKLAGESTMLDILASGYSNVTVLVRPKIFVLAQRCDSQGVLDDEGTYARVTVTIQADPVDTSYDLDILVDGVLAHAEQNITVSSAAAEAKVYIIGNGNYQTDSSYNIEVTVDDSWGVNTVTASDILTTAFFTMDVGNGGKEIAFGAPANDVLTGTDEDRGLFKCNMNALFNGDIDSPGGYKAAGAQIGSYIKLKGAADATITLGTSDKYPAMSELVEKAGNAFSHNTTSNCIECLYDGTIIVQAKIRLGGNYTAQDIIGYGLHNMDEDANFAASQFRVPPNMTAPNQDVFTMAMPAVVSAGDRIRIRIRNATGARGRVQNDNTVISATFIAPSLL